MKTTFRREKLTAERLAALCGGELWKGRNGSVLVASACTDSREADAESLFCALRGERVDGHDYIAAALEQGCRCVLCERSCEALEESSAAAIVVGDVELALSRLANAWRRELSCRVVGVTGSVGKTTTKDMIAAVLASRSRIYCTAGNRNSVIGMPLSMAEIAADDEWAVLEMGMNHFGEIERLSIAAEPNVAVITNIGTSHMEMLGSRENICRAKLEILSGLREGGTLLLNGDEPLLRRISGKSYRTVYVSAERSDADYSIRNVRVENGRTLFDLKWRDGEALGLCIRVMGRHNAYAAAFAFAVGQMNGMSAEEIRAGLLSYTPSGLRQEICEYNGLTLIEDCYNASPESMKAALNVLSDYSRRNGRPSVAVLGDMLELGEKSRMLHREVGAALAALEIDRLVAVGEGGAQIALGARQRGMSADRICCQPEAEQPRKTAELLEALLQGNEVILFKASRGVGAERIVEALKELRKH